MNIDLTDTTSGRINAALVRARRAMGSPAVGMVLTLVIVTDEGSHYDALKAASDASKEHPSRILVVVRRPGRSPRDRAMARLDAEVRVGGETGTGETVLLRLHGELAGHAHSVVLPLLLPDAPVVLWWPADPPEYPSKDPLGALAQRRITDAAETEDPVTALRGRAASYAPGDTDLAWTRVTLWRSVLAAALDQKQARVTRAVVEGEEYNPSSELLALWLADRLRVPVERVLSGGPGITAVRLTTDEGDVCLDRGDGSLATLSVPGQPDRSVALHRRSTAELIAEELRRLDPDETYARAVRFGLDHLVRGEVAEVEAVEAVRAAQAEAARAPGGEQAPPQIVVHPDKERMARATAARLVTAIADAQATRGRAHIALTGGRNGIALLAALAQAPGRSGVDWSRVDLWWGDERFLPDGDPDRNHTQAREALLDALPLDPSRVHPMPACDGPHGDDVDAAAEAYAAELASAGDGGSGGADSGGGAGGPVPVFDVLLLGLGPDTHVASLFPGHPAARETGRTVVGVRQAPKPPPTRISLTLPALRAAREVWLLAAGEDKAEAAADALTSEDPARIPAAGARGHERTLWILDEEAAILLPESVRS
ncbi:glucose-6-phosphate dehydrogenase assembly protein OpcA [Streptomyces sp. CNQ085]|uniref:glucose-6-phosphate dehydrogenase assembly protein OpcA n=1 Tax=Streptomyces sp. CNQ085 TaxID=2886944 RepID=UPI001F50F4C7|nr:glucose-6-phosphate dehydrogenase assembly protein OpcA [Streptomyces sp. CNQ085]MCI0383013.1 glucose-6-phosphate dehydrogenase assembly protein OpcA [Streptomyces sp. CNQ085]